jgi:hypothetical protein
MPTRSQPIERPTGPKKRSFWCWSNTRDNFLPLQRIVAAIQDVCPATSQDAEDQGIFYDFRCFVHPVFVEAYRFACEIFFCSQIEKETAQRLIVVLEKACLETVKVGNNYELLNCDDHTHILKKHKKDPADCRPDICHQVRERKSFAPGSLMYLIALCEVEKCADVSLHRS